MFSTGYSLKMAMSFVRWLPSCGEYFPQGEHMLIQINSALLYCRHWRQVNMIQILINAPKYSEQLLCLKEMLHMDKTIGI